MIKILHKEATISFTSGTSDDFGKKIKRLDIKSNPREWYPYKSNEAVSKSYYRFFEQKY